MRIDCLPDLRATSRRRRPRSRRSGSCRRARSSGTATARISIERYWRLDYDTRRRSATIRRRFTRRSASRSADAVRRRMISDVPLGAFLSGGIDSATVVAAMAEASSEPVQDVLDRLRGEEWSELPNARLVAERFATDHRELIVKPDLLSILPKIARHYGEPFADSSAVPSFYVAEMARREVTVALNGDGGDESFAGYDRYVRAARTHTIASALPGPVRACPGCPGRAAIRAGGSSRVAEPRPAPRRRAAHSRRPARYAEGMSYFDVARARAISTRRSSPKASVALAGRRSSNQPGRALGRARSST